MSRTEARTTSACLLNFNAVRTQPIFLSSSRSGTLRPLTPTIFRSSITPHRTFMRSQLPMRSLSKTKLLAFRQCAKRLWLEVHRSDLQAITSAAEARFQIGYEVGQIARRIYDPDDVGATVNTQMEG